MVLNDLLWMESAMLSALQVAMMACVVAFVGCLALMWQGVLLLNERARARDQRLRAHYAADIAAELVRLFWQCSFLAHLLS